MDYLHKKKNKFSISFLCTIHGIYDICVSLYIFIYIYITGDSQRSGSHAMERSKQ